MKIILILLLLSMIGWGILCWSMAISLNWKNGWICFLLGFVFGLFGLIFILLIDECIERYGRRK